jgi:hypothetical protein
MAHDGSRNERKKIRRAVEVAYIATSDGASSDAILCCDEKRDRFDRFVQIASAVYKCVIAPEEARRTLLGLRKAGVLRRSSDA